MDLKLTVFLAAIFLLATVRAQIGWHCGWDALYPDKLVRCSSNDMRTGFIFKMNYKPGDCFDDTPQRTRHVHCYALDSSNNKIIVDDSECAAFGPKPVETISAEVCVYTWACTTDNITYAPCTTEELTCTTDDPVKAASQCFTSTRSKVDCVNQSGVVSYSHCVDAPPAVSDGTCVVNSGCQGQWACQSNAAFPDTVPDTLPEVPCAKTDNVTGYVSYGCDDKYSGALFRAVKCYYAIDGKVLQDEAVCDPATKPDNVKESPPCAPWTEVIGACVWDRNSCNSGTAEVTYTCNAWQGCLSTKPDPYTVPCTTTENHCTYGFFCAPFGTSLANHQPCAVDDDVGFTLPPAGTCVHEPPQRSVVCRESLMDDDKLIRYTSVSWTTCADDYSIIPSRYNNRPEVVCKYTWQCSTSNDTYSNCADSVFDCPADDPTKADSQCYRGSSTRTVRCRDQYRVPRDYWCAGVAPATSNGSCTVLSGCDAQWVCSAPDAAVPTDLSGPVCMAEDSTTGYPASHTCWEGEPASVTRSVGCYYILDGVVSEDKTGKVCSELKPSTYKLLPACAPWSANVGTCVWDRTSCRGGTVEVTFSCDAPQGCVAAEPPPYSQTCTTSVDHCSYAYACAETASSNATQYSLCRYGDAVAFDVPETDVCSDNVPPRAVACVELLNGEGDVVPGQLVDMWRCAAPGLEQPNESYAESITPCQYTWQCSADGTTFSTCTDDQFTCQVDDPVALEARCYMGVYARTVKCINEDGRIVGDGKCSASGAKPHSSQSSCGSIVGCPTQWVCASTDSAVPVVLPDEACAKSDVTTGFMPYPSCREDVAATLSRDVGCYYVRYDQVTRDDSGLACGGADSMPVTTVTVDKCAPWTLKTGKCVWDGDMNTCTVGIRTDAYVCTEGEGKCVANKPADVTSACTFATPQCGYRYVCAPANTTEDDIRGMSTAELSCGDDKHFAFDATACYKDKIFTRTVACFDAKSGSFSTNAAEDCKDFDAPADRVTRTDEQQCRVDAYCAPTTDAAESAWVKCVNEQGNNVASTFGPCTVDCSTATQTRVAQCANELGSALPDTSCDLEAVALEQYCTVPALVSQVHVSSDTLTVDEEVEVRWCYYDGGIPVEDNSPKHATADTGTTVSTATVTLSSASKKFFTTVVASAAAKAGVVHFDMPVVAPAADAMLTITVGELHTDSSVFAVQSRCAADVTYCGAQGTCIDATSTCLCVDGYTGEQCDVSPCDKCGGAFSHTASCVDSGEEAGVCVCEPGYEGVTCEVKTECKDTRKCQHGGFVGTDADDMCEETCTCTHKWTGANCDTCNNFCTSTANGKPDVDCQGCVCTRGYSGAACQCQQAYGALVFAGASVSTLQNSQWLAALLRAVSVVTGLPENAVEISPAGAAKGIVVAALSICPLQAQDIFHTRAMLDTTALYAKWALVVADLKADTSVLKRGVLADLGAEVSVVASEDMYDPTCTGSACAKGKDPFAGTDNAAAATGAVFNVAVTAAVASLTLLI